MTVPTPADELPGSGKGFQFPGEFEVTAVGAAKGDLPAQVSSLLEQAGLQIVPGSLRQRPSRAGNYVSVTLTIHCTDRAQYEAAHAALRAHPEIRYTL